MPDRAKPDTGSTAGEVNILDGTVNLIDDGHMNVNARQSANDIAPTLGLASRSMIAAMMVRLLARGFDGMTPAFAGLIPLLDAEGSRATVLAQRANVTKQAMSQLVRELEARGYVEQLPDPTDTRAKVVRLTKRGTALRRACVEVRDELQALAEAALGKKRLRRLKEDLAQLTLIFSHPPEG